VKREPRSDEGRDRYDAISQSLVAGAGAIPAKMMGMPILKKDGKAFAGYGSGSMTFKLRGSAHAEALELAGAHLFDPSGMGRPMKEWVEVPASASDHWERLAKAALESAVA
jgi:hypothetical protein